MFFFPPHKHKQEPKFTHGLIISLYKDNKNLGPLFSLIQITIVHFVRFFCLCVCVCFSLFFLTFRRLRFLARGTRSGAARGHGSSLRHHFAFEVNGQIVKETKQTKHIIKTETNSPPPSSLLTKKTGRRNANTFRFIHQTTTNRIVPRHSPVC